MGNPHWRAGDRRASITWRDWLNMVDGQDYLEIGAPSILANDVTHMLYGRGRGDTARFAAGLPLIHDPGAHWNYNSAGTILTADALTRTIVPDPQNSTDRRNRMRAWMQSSLFDPIGMENVSWGKTADGGKVLSHVTVLDEKRRVEEIARMLGGVKITETTRKHAAEMLGVKS
jgi:CubicO group peptidase (beta-lactamase class C family)